MVDPSISYPSILHNEFTHWFCVIFFRTVVAHEIGHNFNAQHTFQLGQGKTGGIMDYGDGKLNGEYQFNTVYSKTEMCTEIVASMSTSSRTGMVPLAACWSSYAPSCGNGIVESGEECDDNGPF
jgi:hypothetical protein